MCGYVRIASLEADWELNTGRQSIVMMRPLLSASGAARLIHLSCAGRLHQLLWGMAWQASHSVASVWTDFRMSMPVYVNTLHSSMLQISYILKKKKKERLLDLKRLLNVELYPFNVCNLQGSLFRYQLSQVPTQVARFDQNVLLRAPPPPNPHQ